MTTPLSRKRLTVQLYGGEDYRVYDGTRLVATVYAHADVEWLLDRDAVAKGTPMSTPLTNEQDEKEQFYNLCQRYRHAPLIDQQYVTQAYEALWEWVVVRDAALRARCMQWQEIASLRTSGDRKFLCEMEALWRQRWPR